MMADHSGHLLVLLVPLAVVAVFQFRRFLPVAAMLLLLHHHLEPSPGSASPTPPPVCCTMAQSTEPTKTEAPTRLVTRFSVPGAEIARPPQGAPPSPPAIRAPPESVELPPLASWTPVFRAA